MGVIGVLISVASIAYAYYLHQTSNRERQPIFAVDPVRTQILNSRRVHDAPIRVLGPDGAQITSDLTSARVYFWNNGKESIKQENVLEPLIVRIDDPNARILDYRIVQVSRAVTKFASQRGATAAELVFTFSILEVGDGAAVDLIYEGDPAAEIVIAGSIESVHRIGTGRNLMEEEGLFWPALRVIAPGVIGAIFGCIAALAVSKRGERAIRRAVFLTLGMGRVVRWAVLALVVVVVVGLLAEMLKLSASKIPLSRSDRIQDADKRLLRLVPEDLKQTFTPLPSTSLDAPQQP